MIEILYKNILTGNWKTMFNKFIFFREDDQYWFVRFNSMRNETWFMPATYSSAEELNLPDVSKIIRIPGMISPTRFIELRSFI